MNLREFKPALRFLGVFLGLYLVLNVLYGIWIESYSSAPDPVTRSVARQTVFLLNHLGYTTTATDNTQGPTSFISNDVKIILRLFEGCNGLNVMIVFVAFVEAFGGPIRKQTWFIPAGIVLIHLANLSRIVLLYFVAVRYQHYFYYIHKYVFTGAIYAMVFALWVVWIKINGNGKKADTA